MEPVVFEGKIPHVFWGLTGHEREVIVIDVVQDSARSSSWLPALFRRRQMGFGRPETQSTSHNTGGTQD
jgi:hypothetical protein